MANRNGGAGGSPRRLFSPAERVRLLGIQLTEPTGFTVEIGGLEFDLHPLTVNQGSEVFELVQEATKLQRKMSAAEKGDGEFNMFDLGEFIAAKGEQILRISKDVLARSAYVDEDDEPAFDEWFGRLPMSQTVRTLIPPILQANGFAQLTQAQTENPQTPAEAVAPPAESTSTPEQPSDSSERITDSSLATLPGV